MPFTDFTPNETLTIKIINKYMCCEKKCDCKNKHTHKTFSCEFCEPSETLSVYKTLEERVKRLEEKDSLRDLDERIDGVLKEPVETPEFEVGERVVNVIGVGNLTLKMTYKILDNLVKEMVRVMDDNGNIDLFPNTFFRKLRKLKEGEGYWLIEEDGNITSDIYLKNYDYTLWELSNMFETKAQAIHARDRIKKFI